MITSNLLRPYVTNMKKFLRMANWKLKLGLGILVFLVAIGILEPFINAVRLGGYDPMEIGRFPRWQRSSWEHPLGTDSFGRDLLAVTLRGLRYTLILCFLSGTIATVIAVILGVLSGYVGGWLDTIIGSFTNGLLVIPTFPIFLLISTYFPRIDLLTMCLILAAFSWPFAARTIRAQVLSLKNREFVNMAKTCGFNDLEIVVKEIIPNMLPYVCTSLAFSIVGAAFAETGARLLGIGPQDIPTLGLILNWVCLLYTSPSPRD